MRRQAAAGCRFSGALGSQRSQNLQASQFRRVITARAFIAFHGSWNRDAVRRVATTSSFNRLRMERPRVTTSSSRMALLEPGRAAHRPSGTAVGPDGARLRERRQGRGIRASPIRVTRTRRASRQPLRRARPTRRRRPFHPKAFTRMLESLKVRPSPTPGGSPEQVDLGRKIFHGEVAGATCAGCATAPTASAHRSVRLSRRGNGCGATGA